MKILTNVKFAQTAGIAQVVLSFMDFVEKSKNNDFNVAAVNLINSDRESYRVSENKKTSAVTIGTKIPSIRDIITKAKNLSQVEKELEKIIQLFQRAIQDQKPDLILINGTYFMPWCLLKASEREKIPAVLHYHGVLTKETQTWDAKPRKMFKEMEKNFNKKGMFYIFPSKITKQVVEKEVFGRRIRKYVVLPNPVSQHFFDAKDKVEKKNIAVVSRWSAVKNTRFCEELAKYNYEHGGKFIFNVITDLKEDDPKYKRLSKFVKFHKPKNNKKLVAFYRNMGVIISPSHFETYGNVAKEAIASGTPAIVNPNMGVSETFKNLGLNDWVINFSSVESVYNKIGDVAGKTVEKEVRIKMNELYPPSKIFSQIVSILNSVVL